MISKQISPVVGFTIKRNVSHSITPNNPGDRPIKKANKSCGYNLGSDHQMITQPNLGFILHEAAVKCIHTEVALLFYWTQAGVRHLNMKRCVMATIESTN